MSELWRCTERERTKILQWVTAEEEQGARALNQKLWVTAAVMGRDWSIPKFYKGCWYLTKTPSSVSLYCRWFKILYCGQTALCPSVSGRAPSLDKTAQLPRMPGRGGSTAIHTDVYTHQRLRTRIHPTVSSQREHPATYPGIHQQRI